MSTPVTVESTLEAIMDSVDHEWCKREVTDVRALLEALVAAVRAEEHEAIRGLKAFDFAHARARDGELLRQERARRERLETALRAYHRANRIRNDAESELYDIGEAALADPQPGEKNE